MNAILPALVFVSHLILGVISTLTVYKALEQNWWLGWLTGIALVIAAPLAEWYFGEAWLVVTVDEMQLLVVAAAIGAVAGVLSILVLMKPDLGRQSQPTQDNARAEHLDS